MTSTAQSIKLSIPPVARVLMIALTLVHAFGIYAAIQIMVIRQDRADEVIFMGLVGFLSLPFSFMLMSIPALLREFPGWVVRIFGASYLERLAVEADTAWKRLTRK